MEPAIASELIRTIFFDLAEDMTPSASVDGSSSSETNSLQEKMFGTYQAKEQKASSRREALEKIWQDKERVKEKARSYSRSREYGGRS